VLKKACKDRKGGSRIKRRTERQEKKKKYAVWFLHGRSKGGSKVVRVGNTGGQSGGKRYSIKNRSWKCFRITKNRVSGGRGKKIGMVGVVTCKGGDSKLSKGGEA